MFECPQLLSWKQCHQRVQMPLSRGWYSEYHWHISGTMTEPRSNPEAHHFLWEAIWTFGYVLKTSCERFGRKESMSARSLPLMPYRESSSKGYHDLNSWNHFWNLRTSGIYKTTLFKLTFIFENGTQLMYVYVCLIWLRLLWIFYCQSDVKKRLYDQPKLYVEKKSECHQSFPLPSALRVDNQMKTP